MGIVVTIAILVGIVERRNRSFLRMGPDSILVLLLYLLTIGGFYVLRGI